jgi:excisionase family DNA binding protein
MNLSSPHIDLGSQEITPKRLAWIMDVGESTVADWIANRDIDHFKKGRLIRFSPAAVTEFIVEYTVRKSRNARGGIAGPVTLQPDEWDKIWERMARLVEAAVESKMLREAA